MVQSVWCDCQVVANFLFIACPLFHSQSVVPFSCMELKLCLDALDAANYRPIAVGKPLYRLYTIILNKRLVGWSEEHQLRSPFQAGFRPGQSPSITSSPCATSLIQLASQGALCMPALWTSRRHMILSSIIFCGTNWSPLGWAPACWRRSGLCIPVALSR